VRPLTRGSKGLQGRASLKRQALILGKGAEADSKAVWLGRDTHFGGVPGFIEFRLLRGPEPGGRPLRLEHGLALARRLRSVDPG
jgi:hypothetical protein